MPKRPNKKDEAAQSGTSAAYILTQEEQKSMTDLLDVVRDIVHPPEPKHARCIHCRSEFTKAEIENISACPTCGTRTPPCSVSDDVDLKINWHELRILTMWAERWAQRIGQEYPDTLQTLKAITRSLEKQYPLNNKLTLTGELKELKQEYPEIELMDANGNKVDLDGEN